MVKLHKGPSAALVLIATGNNVVQDATGFGIKKFLDAEDPLLDLTEFKMGVWRRLFCKTMISMGFSLYCDEVLMKVNLGKGGRVFQGNFLESSDRLTQIYCKIYWYNLHPLPLFCCHQMMTIRLRRW